MAVATATALAILAGAGAAGNAAGNIAGGRGSTAVGHEANANDLKIADQEDKRTRDLTQFGASVAESGSDPFRHITSQADAASALDRMARATPRRLDFSGVDPRYSKYIPKITGGYDASPEMRSSAEVLRNQVLSGRAVAPDVLDPNSPRFGTVDALTLIGRGDTPLANDGPQGGARGVGNGLGAPSVDRNRPMPVPMPGPGSMIPDHATALSQAGVAGAPIPGQGPMRTDLMPRPSLDALPVDASAPATPPGAPLMKPPAMQDPAMQQWLEQLLAGGGSAMPMPIGRGRPRPRPKRPMPLGAPSFEQTALV